MKQQALIWRAKSHKIELPRILVKVFALIFVFLGLLISNAKATGDVKNTDNKADKNLKSIARVNPSTLAMEMSIPLMNYPGRAGNTLPVGISYSSKLWQIRPLLTWWTSSGSGNRIYHTNTKPFFAVRSAAGWTSSLLPPHIIEKLELY
jgi:hypothetical protein